MTKRGGVECYFAPKINIWDETLRDGEQSPGVVFGFDEKLLLAKKSSDFGCNIISTMPCAGESEKLLTKKIVEEVPDIEVSPLTPLKKEYVDMAKDCGCKRIFLFTATSDLHLSKKLKISREENLCRGKRFSDYANSLGMKVDFGFEDASRTDINYLIKMMEGIDNVDNFIIADTLGCLTPFQTYDLIRNLKNNVDARLCLHVHNDFGQATASTLAGICAGADTISGTFNGIGERSGNCSLEEVLVSLKEQYGLNLPVRYDMITDICSSVERYSGVDSSIMKPIVGANAYSHESGIHVSALLKDPLMYENFNPSLVGAKRNILFGKYSGRSNLRYIFGTKHNEDELWDILMDIKEKSIVQKKTFSEKEIRRYYC